MLEFIPKPPSRQIQNEDLKLSDSVLGNSGEAKVYVHSRTANIGRRLANLILSYSTTVFLCIKCIHLTCEFPKSRYSTIWTVLLEESKYHNPTRPCTMVKFKAFPLHLKHTSPMAMQTHITTPQIYNNSQSLDKSASITATTVQVNPRVQTSTNVSSCPYSLRPNSQAQLSPPHPSTHRSPKSHKSYCKQTPP